MSEEKSFKFSLSDEDICSRVKAIMGVPDVFLEDEVITSPAYKEKAEIYLNKQLKQISEIEVDDDTQSLIDMAGSYYICYLLCVSMPLRLPNRMENISTKTLLQQIDWYKFAEEMLGRADEIIDDILEENGIELLGNTFIALSDETTYPNANM